MCDAAPPLEQQLRRRERALAQAQRLTGLGAWEWDLTNDRMSWSDELYAIIGVAPGTLEPSYDAYRRMLYPDDRATLERAVAHAVETRDGYQIEHRVVRPDGELRLVRALADVELDARGEPYCIFGFLQDLTRELEAEHRKTELLRAHLAKQEALTAERRVREVLEAIPQQVWVTDAEGNVLMVNERVRAYFGSSATQAPAVGGAAESRPASIDTLASSMIHPDDYQAVLASWDDAKRTRSTLSVELRLRSDPSRVFRWHLCRAEPQLGPSGEIERWIGTNTDLHVVREAQAAVEEKARELEELTRHLESANEELDRFAYVTSHDLRAPLRGISNLAHWIEEDLVDSAGGETKEHLALLRGRVNRLERLIDGVLRYARAGRRSEHLERVEVARMIEELIDLLDPPDDVRIEIEGALPVLVTERVPLAQVLQNLIDNALTHGRSEHGARVRIRVTRGEGAFTFHVTDDGPGIDPRFHERIWEMFQTLRVEGDGTGVGLALVRKIVEGRGGSASVESVPGSGATFRFTWPEQPSRPLAKGAAVAPLPGSRSMRRTPASGVVPARWSRR
jgi:signal transduction histidine kinase